MARRRGNGLVRRGNGSELRSVSGIISAVIGLAIIYFVGSIAFYKLYGTIDAAALPAEWATLLNAVYDFFGLGMNILFFMFIICIICPLLWIFLGRKRGDQI